VAPPPPQVPVQVGSLTLNSVLAIGDKYFCILLPIADTG